MHNASESLISKSNVDAAVLLPVYKALHDLSQPVTAALCLLELARMQETSKDWRVSMDGCLVEVERIVEGVRRVRQELVLLEGSAL